MGIVIRQSFYTTIISYGGALIGYVNLLYLFPRFLTPDEVGVLRTVQDAAILFSPFAQFGIAQSIYRFHPRVGNDEKSERVFINMLLLMALVAFSLFLIVFTIFRSRIVGYFEENAGEVIQYSSIILWFTLILVLTAVFEAYSRSLLKTVFPNLLREVLIRLLLALLVVLFFLKQISFDQFILGSTLAYVFSLLCLVIYLAIQKKLALTFRFSLMNKVMVKELVQYSLFSFAGTAGMMIIGKIDSLMVASLMGMSAVAVYTTAFYMATIIEYPKRAISQVVMPLIARAFESNNVREISELYRKTSINQFMIGALLLLGIYINLDNIFSLMPRQEIYQAGKWVVVFVGLGKLADMAFGPSSEIIVLSRYYSFNMALIILLAGAAITANNFLIPVWGINGAAVGVAVALFTFNFVKFIFLWMKFRIQPFDRNTVKIIVTIVLCVLLDLALPRILNVFLDMIVRSVAITVLFGVIVLYTRVSPDANGIVASVLRRVGIKSPFGDK